MTVSKMTKKPAKKKPQVKTKKNTPRIGDYRILQMLPATPEWKAIFHEGRNLRQVPLTFWALIERWVSATYQRGKTTRTEKFWKTTTVGFISVGNILAPADEYEDFLCYEHPTFSYDFKKMLESKIGPEKPTGKGMVN